MELNLWKKGVEGHVPALETFMNNVLLRKCRVQLTDVSTGSNTEVTQTLKKYGIILRTVEEKFETEVFFGFGDAWASVLSKEILGTEETHNNEVTKDLFAEFTSHLIEMIRGSFGEIGIDLEVSEVEHIKSGHLDQSLNLQNYLTVSLQVEPEPKSEDAGRGTENPLALVVVMAHPNKDKLELLEVGFTEGNPFVNGSYSEICQQHADIVDVKRVDSTAAMHSNGSSLNVKGQTVEFENFEKPMAAKSSREIRNIDILKNVKMNLSVELGRREMKLGSILQLLKGSVIELEKLAGEPVDILVNGHKIAQGDVVVIDEHFGVRISHLLATQEHIKELG